MGQAAQVLPKGQRPLLCEVASRLVGRLPQASFETDFLLKNQLRGVYSQVPNVF
jgi:hypothetical protein